MMAVAPVIFQSRGFTQIKTVGFRYAWTVNNFSFYCNSMSGRIESPTFSNNANSSELTWHLEINPNGWYHDDKSDVSCMSLYLHLDSRDVSDFDTNFKLSILNTKSEEVHMFEDNKTFGKVKFYGIDSFIDEKTLLKDKVELFPDDDLTIICDITVSAGVLNISEKCKPLPAEHHVANSLEFLFENPSFFSDVTLVSEEKEFKAHRAILAARSAVFKNIFENGMKDKQKNRFELEDVSPEVLCEIIQYIYTDKTSSLDNLEPDVLTAAIRFGLNGLKTLCVNAMSKNLSVENAAEFLILGDRHQEVELKAQANYYICTNVLEVIKTPGWKSMTRKHSRLVNELFCTLATSHLTSLKPIYNFKAEHTSSMPSVRPSDRESSSKSTFGFQNSKLDKPIRKEKKSKGAVMSEHVDTNTTANSSSLNSKSEYTHFEKELASMSSTLSRTFNPDLKFNF